MKLSGKVQSRKVENEKRKMGWEGTMIYRWGYIQRGYSDTAKASFGRRRKKEEDEGKRRGIFPQKKV